MSQGRSTVNIRKEKVNIRWVKETLISLDKFGEREKINQLDSRLTVSLVWTSLIFICNENSGEGINMYTHLFSANYGCLFFYAQSPESHSHHQKFGIRGQFFLHSIPVVLW